MKTFCFSMLLLTVCLTVNAQDGPLTKGQIKLNLGFGVGSYIKIAGGSTSFPPLTASIEYAIDNDLTIGALAGYTATSDTYSGYSYRTTFKYSNLLLGGRVNYYFNVNPKYDVYGGALLGYNVVSANIKDDTVTDGISEGGFLYGAHVGGRYNFSRFTSVFAELGYGIAALNIGLSLNLK